MFDGHELHPSLVTQALVDMPMRHVSRDALQGNPQQSSDRGFVDAIARAGSQGKLDGAGLRSALFALYQGDSYVGFYGMEAASLEDADRLESALREIWSHNASIDRARVHRAGVLLVVAWNDGLPPAVWAQVNAVLKARLIAP